MLSRPLIYRDGGGVTDVEATRAAVLVDMEGLVDSAEKFLRETRAFLTEDEAELFG